MARAITETIRVHDANVGKAVLPCLNLSNNLFDSLQGLLALGFVRGSIMAEVDILDQVFSCCCGRLCFCFVSPICSWRSSIL